MEKERRGRIREGGGWEARKDVSRIDEKIKAQRRPRAALSDN